MAQLVRRWAAGKLHVPCAVRHVRSRAQGRHNCRHTVSGQARGPPSTHWKPPLPAVMRKHFPCEHGCIIELGPDVPAYVVDPAQTLFHYCLLTQVGWGGWGGCSVSRGLLWRQSCLADRWKDVCAAPLHGQPMDLQPLTCTMPTGPSPPTPQKASLCAAKHAATARLCACVPPKEDSRRRLQGTAAVPGNSSAAAGAAAAVQQQPQPGTDLAIGGGPYTGRLRLP